MAAAVAEKEEKKGKQEMAETTGVSALRCFFLFCILRLSFGSRGCANKTSQRLVEAEAAAVEERHTVVAGVERPARLGAGVT